MPELYKFQQKALDDLLGGKHICNMTMGAGKTPTMMRWLYNQSPTKALICTTPSKRDSHDMESEADTWNGENWRTGLDSFEVISWHGLKRWVNAHWDSLADYYYVFDELQKAKAGVSSGMGRAFLRIAGQTKNWTGYTGTPGDTWICYYPYFQAAGLVRNKTAFKARYVSETFFKGYPDIIGYRHEDELLHMWKKISTTPDTSQLKRELPPETHKEVVFKKPSGYDKAIKTRTKPNGDWLDSTMALMHYIRQLCFTKQKQQWVSDFLENLGTNAIFFYTYKEEGDILCDISRKVLPKGSKVWRIDGGHHDVPTEATLGKYDVVLCQWQSGSEAWNAQFIDYFVATTPQYSYSTYQQAQGRIQRIGATRPKFYYELKCERTVEEDIYKTLATKQSFAEEVWLTNNNLTTNEKKDAIDKKENA